MNAFPPKGWAVAAGATCSPRALGTFLRGRRGDPSPIRTPATDTLIADEPSRPRLARAGLAATHERIAAELDLNGAVEFTGSTLSIAVVLAPLRSCANAIGQVQSNRSGMQRSRRSFARPVAIPTARCLSSMTASPGSARRNRPEFGCCSSRCSAPPRRRFCFEQTTARTLATRCGRYFTGGRHGGSRRAAPA
jgi:hypothetical protein